MPAAATLGDMTSHGGSIVGPGVPTVLIGGKPCAVASDIHVCPLPPPAHQPTVSPFPMGSLSVMIAGKPALRTGDLCLCGASIVTGISTVIIG